ncbi:MAG: hemolysin III family protein [Anaerolineaceae bacterium]|nr:hemolysin III family protein [Anaerolineaceae bacterium]
MINKLRQPISGLSHLLGAVLAFIGLIVLIIKGWGDTTRVISYLIYGISLILMFSASAIYHLTSLSEKGQLLLRKMDHLSIYLLIAGTYTPICLLFFSGFWRTGLLIIIWSMALIGIIVKLFVINAPRWVTAGIYLIMGWLCIMAVGEMLRTMSPAAIAWLLIGGVLYSVGAIIYITKKLDFIPGIFGFHEIWHIFVLLAAASHWLMIAMFTT